MSEANLKGEGMDARVISSGTENLLRSYFKYSLNSQ